MNFVRGILDVLNLFKPIHDIGQYICGKNSFSVARLMPYFSKGNRATLWKAAVVVFPQTASANIEALQKCLFWEKHVI